MKLFLFISILLFFIILIAFFIARKVANHIILQDMRDWTCYMKTLEAEELLTEREEFLFVYQGYLVYEKFNEKQRGEVKQIFALIQQLKTPES